MAKKISYRMQTPPNASGERIDIHPVTTTDEVIVNPSSSNPITLTEQLKKMSGITISANKPNHSCLWGRLIRRE